MSLQTTTRYASRSRPSLCQAHRTITFPTSTEAPNCQLTIEPVTDDAIAKLEYVHGWGPFPVKCAVLTEVYQSSAPKQNVDDPQFVRRHEPRITYDARPYLSPFPIPDVYSTEMKRVHLYLERVYIHFRSVDSNWGRAQRWTANGQARSSTQLLRRPTVRLSSRRSPMPQRTTAAPVGAWGAAGYGDVSTPIDRSTARRARPVTRSILN
jgi:hypothetical protein